MTASPKNMHVVSDDLPRKKRKMNPESPSKARTIWTTVLAAAGLSIVSVIAVEIYQASKRKVLADKPATPALPPSLTSIPQAPPSSMLYQQQHMGMPPYGYAMPMGYSPQMQMPPAPQFHISAASPALAASPSSSLPEQAPPWFREYQGSMDKKMEKLEGDLTIARKGLAAILQMAQGEPEEEV